MENYEVIVIGAGVIGSAAAYNLAKEGKKTLLLEQFPLPHTRGSSHGQSRLTRKAYSQNHYSQMMKEAYTMWYKLEEESGNTLMIPSEMLIFGEENSPQMEKNERVLVHVGGEHEVLSPEQLRARYPMLNFERSHSGVIDKGAGVLHANKCVSTMQELFVRFGGKLQDRERVEKIQPGKVITLTTNRGQYRCQSLILTPGPWAKKLLMSVGLDLPIQPLGVTVGYWKQKEATNAYRIGNFPTFVATHGGSDDKGEPLHMYGMPADEYPDHVKIGFHGGQPIDPDARDANLEDKHDVEAMKIFVRSHFPGLEDFPSIAERCIISVTPDEEVFLDCHPTWKNIVIGAGFSGYGFKLAPIAGKILGQLALGIKPDYDISALKLNRLNNKSKL